jgi:hypothetical protein
MKTVFATSLTRVTATLCVSAGILIGALWAYVPAAPVAIASAHTDVAIDPSIPTVTIVAKRLTTAEKKRLAVEDDKAAPAQMVDVGMTGNAHEKATAAF